MRQFPVYYGSNYCPLLGSEPLCLNNDVSKSETASYPFSILARTILARTLLRSLRHDCMLRADGEHADHLRARKATESLRVQARKPGAWV